MNPKTSTWNFLSLFQDETRIHIIKTLQKYEKLCLSDIAKELEKQDHKMKLPAVVKHVQKLEKAGILKSESGKLTKKPDARKTIYMLQEKERTQKIINHLNEIANILNSCTTFNETAKLALKIQTSGGQATKEEIEKLKTQLEKCETKNINQYLTEDEKRNLKLWKMMLTINAPTPTKQKTKPPTITETAETA